MYKFFTTFSKFFLLLIIVLSTISVKNLYCLESKDFVVLLTAKANKTPTPNITLNWKTNGYAKEFYIYRKVKESNYWGTEIAKLGSTATNYIDNNITVGEAYEYQVFAKTLLPVNADTLSYYAVGYVYTGVEVKPIDNYGTVLLLVEKNLEFYFPDKIKRLVDDMTGEGWKVIQLYVDRGDSSFTGKPGDIRKIIKDEYAKDNSINTLFLLGRVPVPYSGNFGPDAHENHQGAWPADVYYGIFDDYYWTDNYVNTDSNGIKYIPSRVENRNIPGDGKFDPSYIREGDVILQIGRVDFYNMPAFSKTEQKLLEDYLDKDHKYRTGEIPVVERGLVDINFQPSYSKTNEGGLEMGFGASGWRNFVPFFGVDSVKNVDWFTSLKTDTYLWAYGCGGGNYSGAGGIGNTSQFADSTPKNAVFTMLFGSYFGDWDSQNNFLRAGLCSSPSILTCAWAGRPQWYLHHMALGLPIGYSAKLSQNNGQTYIPNICYTPLYQNGIVYTYGNLMPHVALMGDPTLRMNMSKPNEQEATIVPPVKNLSVIRTGSKKIEIKWEKPDNNDEYFYNVYFSVGDEGLYSKLNSVLLTELNYTDTVNRGSIVNYMVRAFRIQDTPSGSFYNPSRGETKSIQLTDVDKMAKFENSLTVTPNPATTNVNIEISLKKDAVVSIDIYDINGNKVANLCSNYLAGGTHNLGWNMLNNKFEKINPGVYFVKLTGTGISDAVKLIVMP
ncbi:MAG: T9SS type A sorting domain-containing protein [Ignavibacteriae bacterium]|nr:T9SS type A sorting domain-containing protein [Ignavibacteriota bacterium]